MSAENDDFELDFDDESTPTEVNEDNSPADANTAVEVTTDPAVESAPVATEPVAPTDEEKAAAKAKAEAEKVAAAEAAQKAHDEFVAIVESVMVHDDRDSATGVIPEVLTQQVLDAYAALPGTGGKAGGRKYLSDTMMAKMVAGAEDPNCFLLARSYMELEKKVSASKAKRDTVAKAKVDPTDAFAEQVAALMLAPSLVNVPADVEDTWVEKAQALVESLTGDLGKYQEWVAVSEKEIAEGTDTEKATPAPEVSPIILSAAKVATGRAVGRPRKSGTGTTTPRASTAGSGHTGDIAQHLTEVFEGVASGTFLSVAEIAKGVTSQYGGDKPPPSQGAVSARLFPRNGEFKLDIGITPTDDPKKGAVKN